MSDFEDALHKVFGKHSFSEGLKQQLRLLFEMGPGKPSPACRSSEECYTNSVEMLEEMIRLRRENPQAKCECLTHPTQPLVGFAFSGGLETRCLWIAEATLKEESVSQETNVQMAATMLSTPTGRMWLSASEGRAWLVLGGKSSRTHFVDWRGLARAGW